ncbi:MAG TPA: GNAT family protein [Streptosporangiaceae bacterium]|nr:GNAT family protein [Streptosporangiaceae bacterium]
MKTDRVECQNQAGAPRRGREVKLRGFREDDLATLADWWLHDDVRPMQSDWPVPRPPATMMEVFRGWGSNDPKDDSCALAVDAGGSLAGYVAVLGLRWPSRTGELAVMLGPEHQGQGLGSLVMTELLNVAFAGLDLHRVEVHVFSFNSRAIRLYSSLGFVEEGRLRERVFHRGRRYDEIVMGMLRAEWDTRGARAYSE